MFKRPKIELPDVQPIIDEVRRNGDAALRAFAKKFDGKELDSIEVLKREPVDPALLEALQIAKTNIVKFHEAQLPKEWWMEVSPGVRAGQLVRPIGKVGCYVPGGRYPLVSSVLMTALPAKVAGVKEIIVCTPKATPEILAACDLAGVDRVFEVGGPAAIAAMAYGTETIPKVDKIVGPGSIYVSAAKKAVYGDVAIDFIAGPSEVLIIADDSADPSYVAADMLAQAEHDDRSLAILVTTSSTLVEAVKKIANTPPCQFLVVNSLEEAFAVSNDFAPEHLELMIADLDLVRLVENAGSVFLGPYSPEAAGDYASGPNHVLPTSGFAAAQSGLSTRDFIKMPTVQRLSFEGLQQIAPTVVAIANAEGLKNHAESITVRMNDVIAKKN